MRPKKPSVLPMKAWLDFTPEEQERFKPLIRHLGWKNEGGAAGPLFLVFSVSDSGQGYSRTYSTRNYRDSKVRMFDDTGFYAMWFTLNKANEIAKELGIKIIKQ